MRVCLKRTSALATPTHKINSSVTSGVYLHSYWRSLNLSQSEDSSSPVSNRCSGRLPLFTMPGYADHWGHGSSEDILENSTKRLPCKLVRYVSQTTEE
ncbi:hypothetical protein VTN96DRAFT_7448 [Rasamsonia emersonii]